MTYLSLATLTPLDRLSAVSRMIVPGRGGKHREETVLARLTPLQDIMIEDGPGATLLLPMVKEMLEVISAMRAIDHVFEQDLLYGRHVYALDDITIAALITAHGGGAESPSIRLFELLSTLGLIYRFNVAPKFGIADASKMQLRLNGWGRIAFDSLDCAVETSYRQFVDAVRQVVRANRQEYLELLNLCNSEDRPLKVERINKLVAIVPIAIVT